jgi:hypothetical protein
MKHLTNKTTLKIFLPLSFLMTMFIVSCSTDKQLDTVATSVKLRTANNQLQSNFDSCLNLTKQLIRTQVSEKEFTEYFSLSKRATSFEYDNEVLNLSDSLIQVPKTTQIFYDFMYNGDTLTSFRADFDSNMRVKEYRNFHLRAFRYFIDKELKVTRAEATTIALKNGMKSKGLEVRFNCSADKFYWECRNDCNGCLYLDIDAKTGSIISKGKVVYQY